MVLNRVGQVFEYEDKTYIVGEEIYSNDLDDYSASAITTGREAS